MPILTLPDSWGSLQEANPCHHPKGSPVGGQFCSRAGDVETEIITGERAALHGGTPEMGYVAVVSFKQGSQPVGYISLWDPDARTPRALDADRRYLHVGTIRLEEEFKGKGLGQALYRAAARLAKAKFGKRGLAASQQRTESATATWDRLTQKGLARKSPITGDYFLDADKA